MKGWLFLVIAIVGEVIATSALKSSEGFTKLAPSAVVIIGYGIAFYFRVRCTKHIIAHSQTIRSSLLLLFLSVHNKPYTNWEIYHERLAFSCYRNSWRSNRNIRIKI
nr:SMR family transporter [Acinetobacter baumannii]